MSTWATVSVCRICWERGIRLEEAAHGWWVRHPYERMRIDVQEYTAV